MNKRTRLLVGIFLGVILVYFTLYLQRVEMVFHTEVIDFAAMTEVMNIRNIVTAIYLGPRLFDTFLEVIVVVLTVFGIRFIRDKI
jgi:multisubunit Na+/H+ antiporter MnhB subunit